MVRTFTITILALAMFPATLVFAEKKPQFGPLAACYDGTIEQGLKNVDPPSVLHSPEPEYTESARAAKIQGIVVVQLVLTPEGKVCPEKIIRGLTFELDQNAVKALREWTFKPAQFEGKPVASRLNVEVVFRLY